MDAVASEQASEQATEQALARSLVYRILAGVLRYPSREGGDIGLPDPDEGVRETLDALFDDAGECADLLAELRRRFSSTELARIEESYVELFSHAVRGTCPPYESEYGETRGTFLSPHELSDISAFFRAFGLQISSARHERVDHIAVECEFMHFMAFKQAYAEEKGLTDLVAATRDARIAFLRDHLARWAPAFFRRVMHADREAGGDEGIYSAVSRFGLAFIKADCARLGVVPGSERLRLVVRTETRDDVFECGFPSECPGGGRPEGTDGPGDAGDAV